MTEDKSLFEKRGRGALAEGAARFEGLAKELKTQQIAQIGGVSSTAHRPAAVSPDEEWAKNYMTQSIGARVEMPHMANFTLPTGPPMPSVSFEFGPAELAPPKPGASQIDAPREDGLQFDAPSSMRPRAIGALLGRPERGRSWLGRLLRRKSRDSK